MNADESVHVVVTKDVPADMQEKWLSMAEEISTETWKEDGCMTYAFIRCPEKPGRFVIVEQWASQAHLNAHFETEHFKRLVPLMDAISSTPMLDVCKNAHVAKREPPRTKRNGRILVLYDSATTCTEQIASLIAEGAAQLDRTDIRVRTVPGESQSWDKDPADRKNLHPFATYEDMAWADGVACGTPCNLGCISWRMKKFWDEFSQAGYWNAVDGKIGCSFSSQGGHGGGGELVNQAMNVIMMNCGYSVFGITDYVSFKDTMHYGAAIAKAPRDEHDKMKCRRQGLRLAEFVAYYIIGRDEAHPLVSSKLPDLLKWGGVGIPPRSAELADLVALNTAKFPAKAVNGAPFPAAGLQKRALVFTKMDDYVHGSTPAMASWVQSTLTEFGWSSAVSDDSALLEAGSGHEFDLIVLVNNSGQIFDPAKEVLTEHIAKGKPVVGIHAALASFLNGKDASGATLMTPTNNIIETTFGAHFKNHPPVQTGKVTIDRKAAKAFASALANVPDEFMHTDEFFNFTKNPCDDDAMKVVAYVDESTYEGGLMGSKHPLVWHYEAGPQKAKIFYCALGHFAHFYNGLGPSHVSEIIKAGLSYCCK